MIQVHADFEHGPSVQLIIPNDRIKTNGETVVVMLEANEAETLREQVHLAAYMVRYNVKP